MAQLSGGCNTCGGEVEPDSSSETEELCVLVVTCVPLGSPPFPALPYSSSSYSSYSIYPPLNFRDVHPCHVFPLKSLCSVLPGSSSSSSIDGWAASLRWVCPGLGPFVSLWYVVAEPACVKCAREFPALGHT